MVDVKTVEAALAGLRAGYEADGYELTVEDVSDGAARIRISAGPNACEECLVPKPIAVGIIRKTLTALPEIVRVSVAYPVDK